MQQPFSHCFQPSALQRPMEFIARRTCTCLFSFLLLAISYKGARGFSASSPPLCDRVSLEDLIYYPHDQCPLNPYVSGLVVNDDGIISAVSELDRKALDEVLGSLEIDGSYAAVLFYAKWCPFSTMLRPMYDSLSIAFPSIRHFAVESSGLWPSMLSHYGAHSLPSLFVHNKKVRARFQGHRTLEHLSQFYKDITGLQPIKSISLDELEVTPVKLLPAGAVSYSTSVWSGEWLQKNLYLAVACAFLGGRLLVFLVPRLVIYIKKYWTLIEASQLEPSKMQVKQKELESSSSTNKGKSPLLQENKEVCGKGVMSSLAAVSLAEGSTSRAIGLSENAREIGHVHRGHLWG